MKNLDGLMSVEEYIDYAQHLPVVDMTITEVQNLQHDQKKE